MADTAKLARLLLTLRDGSANKRVTLPSVDLSMSMAAFQEVVALKVGIPSEFQALEMMDGGGIRPKFKPLDIQKSAMRLEEHGIKSGLCILVKDLRKETGTATVRRGKGWEYPPTIGRYGRMERKDMPRDNSCLFHSIAYVTDQKGDQKTTANKMRFLAAEQIGKDPKVFDTAFLGMANSKYVNLVVDPDQWGGGIELSVFSRHFEMEICAFDYHCLREDIFGQGEEYKKRVFLIYTSDHYDVVQWLSQDGKVQYRFSPKDLDAWEKARNMIQGIHALAAKAGKCTLQKQWRREIKRTKPAQKTYTGGSNRLAAAAADSKNLPTSSTETKSTGPPEGKPVEENKKQPEKKVRRLGDDAWSCKACTYVNTILPDRCQVCKTRNPDYRPDPNFFPLAAGLTANDGGAGMGGTPNDSSTPQQLIDAGGGGLGDIDPTLVQQLQLASIPAWICPQCRVLNHRGTIRCALQDCLCPNPIIGGVPPAPRPQQQGNQCTIS